MSHGTRWTPDPTCSDFHPYPLHNGSTGAFLMSVSMRATTARRCIGRYSPSLVSRPLIHGVTTSTLPSSQAKRSFGSAPSPPLPLSRSLLGPAVNQLNYCYLISYACFLGFQMDVRHLMPPTFTFISPETPSPHSHKRRLTLFFLKLVHSRANPVRCPTKLFLLAFLLCVCGGGVILIWYTR